MEARRLTQRAGAGTIEAMRHFAAILIGSVTASVGIGCGPPPQQQTPQYEQRYPPQYQSQYTQSSGDEGLVGEESTSRWPDPPGVPYPTQSPTPNTPTATLPSSTPQPNSPRVAITAQISGAPGDYALALLERHAPTGAYFVRRSRTMQRSYGGSSCRVSLSLGFDFAHYLDGGSIKQLLETIGTGVHETYHGYAKVYGLELAQARGESVCGSFHGYQLEADKAGFFVKKTPIFASNVIVSSVPAALRTSRFSTYIDVNEPNLGTQQEGIFGLLEEFYAYYQGTRTLVEIASFYQNGLQESAESWETYFTTVDGVALAHAEFRYYIARYMLSAQTLKPEIYNQLAGNRELWRAFFAADDAFISLLAKYELTRKNVGAALRARGYVVSDQDGWMGIANPGANSIKRHATYESSRLALNAEVAKAQYANMLAVLRAGSR